MKTFHRILACLLALPLAWQAVTGYILYYRFDTAGKARPWKELLVQLHNGEFLGNVVYFAGLIYVLLILAFVATGIAQLHKNGKKHGEKR